MTHSTGSTHRHLTRRQFLKMTAVGLAAVTLPAPRARASTYRVGVGHNADPYAATLRAINACGEWPPAAISGKTVLVKPNLVLGAAPETGAVTDAQVVRAVVDLALAAGASQIKIVEGAPGGSNYSACGYGFLQNYGGSGRVSLVNLDVLQVQTVALSGGLAYGHIYLPELVTAPDTYLISVGKLKCHAESLVTLATKNVFGLPPKTQYQPPTENGRFAMHYRGLHQATVDINLARPIDFAVVDGVWGMEGLGPFSGTPVRMDAVVAGVNPVAVDRVCLQIMSVPQAAPSHLAFAARLGLGPASLDGVQVLGDTVTPRAFTIPPIPPLVEYPRLDPPSFFPQGGQTATAAYWVSRASAQQVEVVRLSDDSVVVERVRLLQDWVNADAGHQIVNWDGRDDAGEYALPGRYAIRVEADGGQPSRNAFATGWVEVLSEPVTRRVFLPLIAR